jgi:hypothetical protein
MTEDLKLPVPAISLPQNGRQLDGAWCFDAVPYFTADQLKAAVAAERERCALLCDDHAAKHRSFASGSYSQGRMYAAEDLAAAIRGHAEEKQ